MWKPAWILVIFLVHGALPGTLLTTLPALSVLDLMTQDITLKKCGIPSKADLMNQFSSLRYCSIIPPSPDVNPFDKFNGISFVCYTLFDQMLRWCEPHDKKLDDLLVAFHNIDPSDSYSVDKACAQDGGGLVKVLKPTLFNQGKAYVGRLLTEFKSAEQCQEICFNNGKIEELCRFLLIADRIENVIASAKFNVPTNPVPKINLEHKLDGQYKVRENILPNLNSDGVNKVTLNAQIDQSPLKHSMSGSVIDKNQKDTMSSKVDNTIQSYPAQSSQTALVPAVQSHNEILSKEPLKTVNLQQEIQNVQTKPVVKNDAQTKQVVKNNENKPQVELGNLEKPGIAIQITNSQSSDISVDPQKGIVNSVNIATTNDPIIVNDIFNKKDDYPDENPDGADDLQDENDGVYISSSNKDAVRPNIISEQTQHDTTKNKIDILQTGENDIFHAGQQFEAEDSNFFTYFLVSIGVFIFGYVLFHNKHKVLGLLVEGRRSNSTSRRRGVGSTASYRKLDCTLEEAVSSAPPSHGPNIVY